MKTLLVLALVVLGCGRASDSDDAAPAAQNNRSRYVLTMADLPECNEGMEASLVYVKAEKKLKACLSGTWEDVELEDEEEELSKNMWKDPITGKTWLLGSTASVANAVDLICTNGAAGTEFAGSWVAAKEADLKTARDHGLYAALAASLGAAYECALTETNNVFVQMKPGATCTAYGTYSYYCVKK